MFPLRDVNPTRVRPVVTVLLIVVNTFVFFGLLAPRPPEEVERFVYANAVIACELVTGEPLSPTEIRSGICSDRPEPAAFPHKSLLLSAFVSMFLHASVLHLAGNMWFLWIFGNNVEEAYGRLGFLGMYLAAGLVGTLAFVLANPSSTVPLVGASGAIAGVLGAYAVLFPNHQVLTLVVVFFVPIPAIVFLVIWFLSQFGVADPGVAWQAHVGGFLAGMGITALLRRHLVARLAAIHRPRLPLMG